MAFSTLISSELYTGNGTANTFAIPFNITGPEEVVVELWDVTDPLVPVKVTPFVSPTDWSIPVPFTDVVTAMPVPVNFELLVYRVTEDTHDTNYSTYQFPFQTVNQDLDQVYQAIQELRRDMATTLKDTIRNAEAGEIPLTMDQMRASLGQFAQIDAAVLAAETAATNAGISEGVAVGAAGDAIVAADTATDAADEASLILFNGSVNINNLDSPVALNNTFNDTIVFVDANEGSIIINLSPIASYPTPYKTQFIRQDSSPNTVTIVANGAETIDGDPTFLLPSGVTIILSPASPTNWQKKFLGLVNGGSILPVGATAGDYLEHDGSDAIWQSGEFSGFSARFSATINATSVRDALLQIFNFTYLGPQASLNASGSGTVREKGNAVTSSTLTATVTRRTDPIARIQFFLGGVAIPGADFNPPGNTGSGDQVYAWTGSFSDTSTFRVDVTDNGTSGGPTTVSASATFTFVYPYYFGTAAPGITAAAVAALTKDIRVSTATLNKVFTAGAGDVYYFAYPASYGALTSILDENGFETFGDWTLRTENITGLDATAQSYRIYEFNNPSAGGTTNYTFIR